MSDFYWKWVTISAAAAAALAITGDRAAIPLLIYLFKPLATILIELIAFTNWRAQRARYAFWIFLGLIFSLAGDILLIWPAQYFEFGLGAFLCAHIVYLIAFTRGVKLAASRAAWLLYVAIGVGMTSILWHGLPAFLRFPVVLYAFFLSAMAGQAMERFLSLRTSAARLAAIGAIFFMLSDSFLGFSRFYSPFPASGPLILGAYYLAQWMIASSTLRMPGDRSVNA